VIADLIRGSARLPSLTTEPLYAICAREAVDDAPAGTLSITAKDMFGAADGGSA